MHHITIFFVIVVGGESYRGITQVSRLTDDLHLRDSFDEPFKVSHGRNFKSNEVLETSPERSKETLPCRTSGCGSKGLCRNSASQADSRRPAQMLRKHRLQPLKLGMGGSQADPRLLLLPEGLHLYHVQSASRLEDGDRVKNESLKPTLRS